MSDFRVPYQAAETEFTEKRSRFIGHLLPVETEEQAREFIAQMKKKYYDARHNCWCYLIGRDVLRYGDDGEPQGTAGQPMLNVFQRENVTNVVCVVTRYFGGTLLGTGGLVRAYTAAAKAGVEASEVIEKIPAVQFLVKVAYNQIGTLLYLLGQRGYSQLESEYAEDVSVRFLVPLTERASMEKQLLESFQGSAKTEIEDYGYYAKNGKELLLFEEEV